MIRVSGGAFRGRRLKVAPGVRPTTELARKAAFDILGPRVSGARVLDAAAGSGAYGIEALSRGASGAVFVEAAAPASRALADNLRALEVGERALVIRDSIARFLRLAGERYDVVFYDPPWDAPSDEDLEGLLDLTAAGGVLVHERGDPALPAIGRTPQDVRSYGRTRLLFYFCR